MNLPQLLADAMKQPGLDTMTGTSEGSGATKLPLEVTPDVTIEEGAQQKAMDALRDAITRGDATGAEGEGDGSSAASVTMPVAVSPEPVVEEGAGEKLVNAVAGAISSAVGAVTDAGKSISKAAATAFSSETGSAKTAGGDMVQGLIQGANDKRSALIATFEGLMLAAILAAKHKAGIASPSKVFRGIGQNIADSFALGVDERMLSSQRAVERLVGVPANTSKSAPRAAALTIDYGKLADAMASRPTILNVNGKAFAQATATENTSAVASRQRRLDLGKGLV
jgi:hypothetical protein